MKVVLHHVNDSEKVGTEYFESTFIVNYDSVRYKSLLDTGKAFSKENKKIICYGFHSWKTVDLKMIRYFQEQRLKFIMEIKARERKKERKKERKQKITHIFSTMVCTDFVF
jgi:capsule polysaccharide export protein KpsC/LpsZ